jgi:hypothetical protein
MDEAETLRAATRRYRRTEASHEEARQAAISAVLAALRAGMRPTDVIAASPFTGVYVRRLAREAGIEPRKKGDRPARRDDTE